MSVADKLHRANACYRAVQADAARIVCDALDRFGEPAAVAVSGGKDSVAMAHLVCAVMANRRMGTPVLLHTDSGLELRDSLPVCERLAKMLKVSLEVARGVDARELKREMGTREAERVEDELCIFAPTRKALHGMAIAVEFVGLRMAESKRRYMLIGRMGPVNFSKKYGCGVAWPMRSWSGSDVFAYIDEHNLPLHPAYAVAMGVPREERRVSWSYDSSFEKKGSAEFLRRYDPSLYRQLREEGILCSAR